MRKIKILLMTFAVLFLLVGAVNASDVGNMADGAMLNGDSYNLNAGDGILSSDNGLLQSDEIVLSSDDSLSSDGIALSSDEDISSSDDNILSSNDDSQSLEAEKNFDGSSFSQLQSEINNCSKNDTILLNNDISQAGSNPITIQKSLTIDGNGHTIDAQGKSGIFQINYANLTLRNIIFKNGKGASFGAIAIIGGQCNIINCSFENNQGYFDGAAISSSSGSLNLSGCTFRDNKAINKDGGAVYSLSDTYMSNCTFINNSASYGGAVYSLNCIIMDCSFINNSADLGGAVYCKGTSLTIEFSQFLDNAVSNNGGALFLNSVKESNISSSSFYRNNASLEGGAIYCNNSNISIESTFFRNNNALKAGAVYYANSTDSIDTCYFYENIASEDGGAIVFNDSNSSIRTSDFEFNIAGKKGAAIYWNLSDNDHQCNISGSNFLNNKAESYSLTGNYTEGNLNFIMTGWSNYVNAIYAESAIYLYDVEYWNGRISNTDYGFYYNAASGQDIILEIYDSQNLLVTNVTLMTDSFGKQYFTTSYLDDGNYIYKAYHLENSYYTYVECIGNFTLNRPASSVSINIDDNAEFYYLGCTIPFDISNRTAVRVLLTNENGSYVYLNGSLGQYDRNISVFWDSSDEYYNITVFNLPNNLYRGSQDSKLFKILAANSSISINPIDDVAYGKTINVTYSVENETIVELDLYDENEEKLFTLFPLNGRIRLPILPAGQYNLSMRNVASPNICGSNDSIRFNVLKADNQVNITADDVVYGNKTTILISADANGNYTLDINGTLIDVEVYRGKGRLEMALPAGEYYINGTFNNTNYNTFITNTTCSVSKADHAAFIVVDDTFDGDQAVIRIYSHINGIYLLDVNGTLMNVSVFNGIGKATMMLPVGAYYANASFDNPNYNTVINNTTFRVEQLVYGGSNEGGSAGNIYYNESSSGNGSSSANGTGSGNATGSDDSSVTVRTFSRFSGNKNISMYYFDGSKYSFKVYGDNGKPVGANQVVAVKLNGKTYQLKTNKNGIVSLTIPKTVKPGKYEISASYKGQTILNTINVKQILSSKKLVKVKRTAKKLILTAKLKKKLKGKKITFKFRAKKYTAKTNKKGIAKVSINKKVLKKLKRGKKYNLVITYYKVSLKTKVKVI